MSEKPVFKAAPSAPIQRNVEVRAFLYGNCVIGDDDMRFRQIDRYEAHYRGTQYNHLTADWWGQNADVNETISPRVMVPAGFEQPMIGLNVRSRRPTAPLQLTRAVVDRFTGLLFSDTRKPDIQVEGDEDTEAFLSAVMQAGHFWAEMRKARTVGGSCGSVLLTCGLRNGEFCFETHKPQYITVLWKDKRRLIPEAVLKMYKHVKYEDVLDEKTRERKGVREVVWLYRRIITEFEDVVFKEVRLDDALMDLKWEEESAVQHNLGFFPGVWVQNLPVTDSHDGDPDCQLGYQKLDTIDRIVSQINQGVLLNLDPTLVLGYDPKSIMPGMSVSKGSDNALHVGVDGKATYLEISGTGVEAGIKTVNLLRQAFLELVRCVMIDPATISGSAQSAKAIELIYAPMLEKADDLRAQWGDLCVVPILRIVERIARKFFDQSGDSVSYKFILPPRVIESADGKPVYVDQKLGPGGYIQCKWGAYFSPTEQDDKQRIDNAVAAKAGGLIDHLGAIKHTAQVFGAENPVEIKRLVDEEEDAEQAKAMATMDAQVPFSGGHDDGGGNPNPSSPKPAFPDNGPGPGAGEGGKP